MLKKTTTESNDDEQPEAFIQGEDKVKSEKFDPECSTTLSNLPIEILECILVKTTVMEVKSSKLAKSVWKEKANLVIRRLRPVCSLWSNILSTDSFRIKLHRILDSTSQTIRLEILHESSIGSEYFAMTTLKDEIFLLYGLHTPPTVNVYDRDNMAEVKETIPLPGTYSQHMSGCNASNCVYILCRSYGDLFSVFRISRDDEHKFHVSQWIKHNPRRSVFLMNVSANGSLAICSSGIGEHRNSNFLGAYEADGSLQHEIMLPTDMHVRIYKNVIRKLNGNLVLAYLDKLTPYPRLLEFDTQGRVVRRFQSSLVTCGSRMDLADDNDRMMIVRMSEGIELLDSEFNPLGIYTPQKDRGKTIRFYDLHYDCNRNEIVRSQRIGNGWDTRVSVLTVFRFTEELTTRNDGTS